MQGRRASIVGLLAVALAIGPAVQAAPAARDPAGGDTPAPKRAALRGPETPTPAKPATLAAAKPLPVAFATRTASPMPPDVGQCRLDCGQAYYFCLEDRDQDQCSSSWTSCRAACAEPPEAP